MTTADLSREELEKAYADAYVHIKMQAQVIVNLNRKLEEARAARERLLEMNEQLVEDAGHHLRLLEWIQRRLTDAVFSAN